MCYYHTGTISPGSPCSYWDDEKITFPRGIPLQITEKESQLTFKCVLFKLNGIPHDTTMIKEENNKVSCFFAQEISQKTYNLVGNNSNVNHKQT